MVAAGEEEGGVLEAIDVDSIDRDHGVSRTQSGRRGRRPGGYRVDDDLPLDPPNRKIEAVEAVDGADQ